MKNNNHPYLALLFDTLILQPKTQENRKTKAGMIWTISRKMLKSVISPVTKP